MPHNRHETLQPALALGACIMVGLMVGGWLLGSQIKAIKLADRYVTVKVSSSEPSTLTPPSGRSAAPRLQPTMRAVAELPPIPPL